MASGHHRPAGQRERLAVYSFDDHYAFGMTETPQFCTVAVTFDNDDDAAKVAKTIIEERLAACAQTEGPITSTYWWEGKVETDQEWRVDFKTTTALLGKLTARVVELHSYDVPQVIALPIVGGLDAYLQWIEDETNGDADS